MKRLHCWILCAGLVLGTVGCRPPFEELRESAGVSSEEESDKAPARTTAARPTEAPAEPSRPAETGATPEEDKPPALVEEHKHKTVYGFSDDTVSITGDLSKPDGELAEPPAKMAPPPRSDRAGKDKTGHGRRPGSAGVKAGSADDNLQFGAFLDFLAKNDRLGVACDVSQRVVVQVLDKAGRPLPDASVEVRDRDELLLSRRSYSDGRALVFPSESERLRSQSAVLVVRAAGKQRTQGLNTGRHKIEVRFDFPRPEVKPVPLDVAFVLDTTGSMSDEIARLKQTIEYIHFQLTHFEPRPDVRFGMVLYRDRGDDYCTRLVPFTSDMQAFEHRLAEVQAGGGGDTPEDVQEAMHQAMWKLDWRPRGVKIAFLIGDAPPHLDYGQRITYIEAMRRAAQLGVKIATIGASGLDRHGELVWRQLAQYTMAPFVFLTYGEKGDSEGSTSAVSHHVGSNWVAENLDAIVVRMVKLELTHYGSKVSPGAEDYFLADASASRPAGEVLEDLFRQSVRQLVDYCVQRIDPATPTVVLPLGVSREVAALAAKVGKRLQDRLAVVLAQSGRFQLVEREDLPKVLATMSEQFSNKYDGSKVAEMGKLVPAKLALFSRLSSGNEGRLEMLIKLVRLQSGEILSLSLLKIDRKLLK